MEVYGDKLECDVPESTSRSKFSFCCQFQALMKKNMVLQKRQHTSNLILVAFPLFMSILLVVSQSMVNEFISTSPVDLYTEEINHPPLNPHIVYASPGIKLGDSKHVLQQVFYNSRGQPDVGKYRNPPLDEEAPSSDDIEQSLYPPNRLLDRCTMSLEETVGISTLYKVTSYSEKALEHIYYVIPNLVEVSSNETLESIVLGTWNESGCAWAYDFEKANLDQRVLSYSIYYNHTDDAYASVPVFEQFISNGLFRIYNPNPKSYLKNIGSKSFPSPQRINSLDVVVSSIPILYSSILLMPLASIMQQIVEERESRLRDTMRMMGLKEYIYFISTHLWFYILYTIYFCIMLVIGLLLDFDFWKKSQPVNYFLLFFIWGNTMISLAWFLSTLIKKSLNATIIAYSIVLVASIFNMEIIERMLMNPYTYPVLLFFLNVLPPTTLLRGMIILSKPFEGTLEDNVDYLTDQNLYRTCAYLAAQFLVLSLLALYFDQVLPIGPGPKKHYLFFIPKRWRRRGTGTQQSECIRNIIKSELETVDVCELESSDGQKVLKIRSLCKAYSRHPVHLVVKDLSMEIKDGECYGFLGPNGAGKSTTISMICGHVKPSYGQIYVKNQSLFENREEIHLHLGVCPQDDALYNQMTGLEHLELYGRMKNLSGDLLKQNVRYWLERVNLWKKGDRSKLVHKYSGGMKRRLSVACALIGYPSLVLLDEPTTGLDPASRNELWRLVKAFKTQSAILLTTHSMKEAEVLCDTIGIIVAGELRVTGQVPELIQKYCDYYVIKMILPAGNMEEVTECLRSFSPDIAFVNRLDNQYTFEVPVKGLALSSIFSMMNENQERLGVREWAVHNSTLERAFVSVVSKNTKEEDENIVVKPNYLTSIWNQLKGWTRKRSQ